MTKQVTMMNKGIDSLFVRIGRTQYRDDVGVDLVKDAAHIVFQGKTRSGKSQATYNFLAQVAQSPAVRVVGSDPTTVLLSPFADRLPEEKRLVLGPDDQKRTVEMLEFVKRESDRRITKMRELDIDKYEVFSPSFPIILLVLEEFPGIVEASRDEDAAEARKPAERVAPRLQALVRQIAAQGAKAGIRILLLAQRAEADIVGGAARSNFAVKMTLRLDEPESVRMLHPSVTPDEMDAVGNFQPGQALFERPGEVREIIRNDFVGDYRTYSSVVRSADLAYLADLGTDKRQRLTIAEEFPEIGDPG